VLKKISCVKGILNCIHSSVLIKIQPDARACRYFVMHKGIPIAIVRIRQKL